MKEQERIEINAVSWYLLVHPVRISFHLSTNRYFFVPIAFGIYALTEEHVYFLSHQRPTAASRANVATKTPNVMTWTSCGATKAQSG